MWGCEWADTPPFTKWRILVRSRNSLSLLIKGGRTKYNMGQSRKSWTFLVSAFAGGREDLAQLLSSLWRPQNWILYPLPHDLMLEMIGMPKLFFVMLKLMHGSGSKGTSFHRGISWCLFRRCHLEVGGVWPTRWPSKLNQKYCGKVVWLIYMA